MKHINVCWSVTLLLPLAALAACSVASRSERGTAMTTDTTSIVHGVTASRFCIGRFTIDLPVSTRLNGGGYKYDFTRVEKPNLTSVETFNHDVDSRERALDSVKHKKEKSLLRQTIRPDGATRLLVHWERSSSEFQVRIEGYRWVEGTGFLIADQVDTDRQDHGIRQMKETLARLRPRADTDIPTDPGYCFEGGFIANEKWENERIDVSFRLPQHPDVRLLIMVLPKANPGPGLLERTGGALKKMGAMAAGIHPLRQRDRQIDRYKGQEYLFSAPISGGSRGHSFQWETQGEGYLQFPYISIEMRTGNQDDNGNPQPSSLNDPQALALWDSIVGTFRLRPTTVPEKPAQPPPPNDPQGD